MKRNIVGSCVTALALIVLTFAPAGAHEGHENHSEAEETSGTTTLTGEVVDVSCYLSHGAEGLGPKHAGCAKKCILGGLPVAIRSGGELYLATMADHTSPNQTLAEFAGKEVEVHGQIMEQDGMKVVSIEKIEGR